MTPDDLLAHLIAHPNQVVAVRVPITERFTLHLPDVPEGNWFRNGTIMLPGPIRMSGGVELLALWTGGKLHSPGEQVVVAQDRPATSNTP